MECYKLTRPDSSGRVIVFGAAPASAHIPIRLPCGKCWGCRLDYSRDWAVRIMHESMMHEQNHFITLTYDNEHLPPDLSLNGQHLRTFFKNLRRQTGQRFRYYVAGEYGEKFGRPHYHAAIFGLNLSDKVLLREIYGGYRLYTSCAISNAWTFGYHSIGEVTFESAGYIARYVVKKRTGKASFTSNIYNDETGLFEEKVFASAEDYYERVDKNTGEVFNRYPEFCRMSRMPGLGTAWLDKFRSDLFGVKAVVLPNGKKCRIPRFYLDKLDKSDAAEFVLKIKAEKRKFALDNEVSIDRLEIMEKCQIEKAKKLIRKTHGTT